MNKYIYIHYLLFLLLLLFKDWSSTFDMHEDSKEDNNSSVSTSATTTASITSSLTDNAEIRLLNDFNITTTTASITSSLTDNAEIRLLNDFNIDVFSDLDDHSDSSFQKILNDEESLHISEFNESLTSSNEIFANPNNNYNNICSNEISRGPANRWYNYVRQFPQGNNYNNNYYLIVIIFISFIYKYCRTQT
jgi:hypothetical protein